MSDTKELYEITIIGGGPVGLFAAFYAGIRKAKTKIIDSLPQLGGQLSMLYPEKYIYDIPGYPVIKAIDLINNLEKQIQPFDHTTCLEEEVLDLIQEEDYLRIETSKGTHYSKAVIFAIGNGSFQPRRLAVDGADAFEDKHIHYYVKDMNKFAGKKVAIAGGGDSAIDWALMLESVAEKVSIIHRRPEFRGHEHSVDNLEKSEVAIFTPYVIENLLIDNNEFKGVQLKKSKTDEYEHLDLDSLIINYGFTSSLGHLKKWGLEINRSTIEVNSDMSTNLPGVYAVGDISNYQGKVKLIATGFGEAPTAVNNALHFIKPDSRRQPMHSTSLFEGSGVV
ncbi:NAD(P)/FAD-dependent oxidoreductase [Enterococcus rivorum]|uniref:Ferredoxin--NADP reductase n=1 Tax=Enterococcus rivorum TaxID=762845 RepID=A0A1E5KTB7_9ENTE|nr:NAD(P)/FAD-dependent oxidoreductase [Enterococcus rivorum]MBP2100739.1 thioredoxin reductase (NADPH) [Enterococcus rivorum]OEH81127.1 ferredoxin--NADP(+) reductase [Enterococcus rivorum]